MRKLTTANRYNKRRSSQVIAADRDLGSYESQHRLHPLGTHHVRFANLARIGRAKPGPWTDGFAAETTRAQSFSSTLHFDPKKGTVRIKPMWYSGVRKPLKFAAVEAGYDFLGFGLHSFRRANITMRQEEGGSSIEASKIAGHATVSQTGDYTIVQLKRQAELTRAIQDRLEEAARRIPRA